MPREFGADQILAADQIDPESEIARGRHGAINGMGRRVIATHRINGDAHVGISTDPRSSGRDIGAAVRSINLR